MDNTVSSNRVGSDRAAMIRQSMEQTKRRLTQSLATLETQVTEKVQHAGTAVNATAEAVQEAVHSVGKAFDMERQFRRHPWLFVGGSMAIGYVATELLRNGNSNHSVFLVLFGVHHQFARRNLHDGPVMSGFFRVFRRKCSNASREQCQSHGSG